MGRLLGSIGFTSSEMALNATERELIDDLWAMIKAEKTGGADKDALRLCLLAVVGISLKERTKAAESPEKERNEDGEEPGETPEDWGYYDDDTKEFLFRPREQSKAFAHFKYLYVNHMQTTGQSKRTEPVEEAPVESVKPKISKKTEQIAMKRRQKIAGEGKQINLIEILLHPKDEEYK